MFYAFLLFQLKNLIKRQKKGLKKETLKDFFLENKMKIRLSKEYWNFCKSSWTIKCRNCETKLSFTSHEIADLNNRFYICPVCKNSVLIRFEETIHNTYLKLIKMRKAKWIKWYKKQKNKNNFFINLKDAFIDWLNS